MPLSTTVLFDLPQSEIASLIVDRLGKAIGTSIVSGFATPGGLAAIADPIKARPTVLKALVVGSATYSGFQALDGLLAAGVQKNRLYVHLGHTSQTGGANTFARYHPMLHSKLYFMELPNSNACAFIGSHNITAFALTGLNGEAAIMLEGPSNSPEFDKIRAHISTARTQAVEYSPAMKEAFAWWTREFFNGLRAEIEVPAQETISARTILLFAGAAKTDRPRAGDRLYFEIPAGIRQIQSLNTKAHLFVFDSLPLNPREALSRAAHANASYTCQIVGADNRQGNREVIADWAIASSPMPILNRVPGGTFQPNTSSGMQQVRVEVESDNVEPYEYLFQREKDGWEPLFSDKDALTPTAPRRYVSPAEAKYVASESMSHALRTETTSGNRVSSWKLVKGLIPRKSVGRERDEEVLRLVAPDSGSFILVSLLRRRRD